MIKLLTVTDAPLLSSQVKLASCVGPTPLSFMPLTWISHLCDIYFSLLYSG
jgi:hypothetical protein